MAALFFRQVERCRSTQLAEIFSLPPINHLAKGGFHSNVFFHGLSQSNNSLAWALQNFSGFLTESRYIFSYCAGLFMWAPFEKAGEGLKIRFSLRMDVISDMRLIISWTAKEK